MLAAAILRAFEVPLVSEDYLDEPVGGKGPFFVDRAVLTAQELVTRLLHQLHFVAEQTPLDASSYSLTSILLSRVVDKGGIGVESAQSEQAQEQLTLVRNRVLTIAPFPDYFRLSTSSAPAAASVSVSTRTNGPALTSFAVQDDAYPRLQSIKDLLHVIAAHSKLAKDATSALVDLGAAIKDVATPEEVRELIAGTLSKDSNVRNAALQALQVGLRGSNRHLHADVHEAGRLDGLGLLRGVVDSRA
jgi:hypothetical protein